VWILFLANISASQGQQASKSQLQGLEPLPVNDSTSSSTELQSHATARRVYDGEACHTGKAGNHECLYEIASSCADIFSSVGKFAVTVAKGEKIETEDMNDFLDTTASAVAAIAPMFVMAPYNTFAALVAPMVGGLISSFLGFEVPDELKVLKNELQGYVERRLIDVQLSQNSYRLQALSDEFTWTKGLFKNANESESVASAQVAWQFTAQHSMASDVHLFLSTDCMATNALPENFAEISKDTYCSSNARTDHWTTSGDHFVDDHRLHKSATTLEDCITACLSEPTCKYLTFYEGEKGFDGSQDEAFCRLSEKCTEFKESSNKPTRVLQKSFRVDYAKLFNKTDNSGTQCNVNDKTQGKFWYVGDRDTTEEECQAACTKDASCRYVTYHHGWNGGQPKCALTSECIAVRSESPPSTVWQKKFLTGATKSCQQWRQAVAPVVVQSYASLHMSVLADIMGSNPEFSEGTRCQMVKVGLRYLVHMRVAFAEYLEFVLKDFESPRVEESFLSGKYLKGGYDHRYGREGAGCGRKGSYDSRCDILVQCGMVHKHRYYGRWSTTRRFNAPYGASDVLECFDRQRRNLANSFSKGFELAYYELKKQVDALIPFCEESLHDVHDQLIYSEVIAR